MSSPPEEHSFIHGIRIAAPCDVSWDTMTGDEKTRHCQSCKLNVYNIASLTTAEAEALILEKEGNVCVRLFRRKDGTILTKDCPKGIAAIRARYYRCIAATATLVSLCAAYLLNSSKVSSGISRAANQAITKCEQVKQDYSAQVISGQMQRTEIRGKMMLPDRTTTDTQVIERFQSVKQGQ